MPSQKQRQGMVRRAKALTSCVETDGSWWVTDNYNRSRHGQPGCPPAGHPCCRCFVTFFERFVEALEAEEGETGTEGAVLCTAESSNKEHPRVLACVAEVVHAVRSAHTKRPQVLVNKQTRALFKAFFLPIMTQITENESKPPLRFVAVVLMIEDLVTCRETSFD